MTHLEQTMIDNLPNFSTHQLIAVLATTRAKSETERTEQDKLLLEHIGPHLLGHYAQAAYIASEEELERKVAEFAANAGINI